MSRSNNGLAVQLPDDAGYFSLPQIRRTNPPILRRDEAAHHPPAPTSPRIAVGFSGESVQPVCACRAVTVQRANTAASTVKRVLFIYENLPRESIGGPAKAGSQDTCIIRLSF